MYLEYGVSDCGELVYIGDAKRGKTPLTCPYCKVPLIARKGEHLAHHFAHDGPTCREVLRIDSVSLPCYDDFHLHLPAKAVEELHCFQFGGGLFNPYYLEEFGLVAHNDWKGRHGGFELTKKGKLVLGELSLNLFVQFQEPLILARHNELETRVTNNTMQTLLLRERDRLDERLTHIAHQIAAGKPQDIVWSLEFWLSSLEHKRDELLEERERLNRKIAKYDLETAKVDLMLYRAQWQRILQVSLYCLKINNGELYKIGVTSRPVEQRIAEVRRDLAPHLGNVQIDIVSTWSHRGNVERYFKYRYAKFQYRLGSLTEYFKFDDPAPVIRDLRRMPTNKLSDFERRVWAGDLPPILEAQRLIEVEQRRREGIRQGMQRAKSRGKTLGRPKKTEPTPDAEIITKFPAIVAALRSGLVLRAAASKTQYSVNTVIKVKKALARMKASNTPTSDQEQTD